jgi:hypothetical protein
MKHKKQLSLSWHAKEDSNSFDYTHQLHIEIGVLENDGTPDNPKWRNVTDLSDTPGYYDLTCTGYAKGREIEGSYGWGIEYRNAYSVDLRRAKQMLKTLAAVDKTMEKMRTQEGNPQTFGQFVNRFARAIGASYLIVWDPSHKSFFYSERTYKSWKLADIPFTVDRMIAEFHGKHAAEHVQTA